MAYTTVNSGNRVKKYDAELLKEYVRGNAFSPYIGTSVNSPIVMKEDSSGKLVSIPFATKLSGNGVSGSTALRGSEESIGNYAFDLTPTYYRNGVTFTKEELDKPAFDMRSEAKPLLRDWGIELVRDQIIQALCAVHNGSDYNNWADASAAQRNSWLVANSDRVLFGTAKSNYSGVVATDLAKVDSTNDKLDRDIIGIAARMAKTASPKIRPWRNMDANYEQYVMFVGSRAYRDLYNNTTVVGNLQYAMQRAKDNPLFQPGDLMFDNVLVREVPEITTLLTASADFATAGDSSLPVEPCFLVGAQAIGYGMSRRPSTKEDNTYDYGFQPGVAIEMKHDIRKMHYNNKQHGVVTVFVSGTADA